MFSIVQRSWLWCAAALVVAGAGMVQRAQAANVTYIATLTGAAELPPNASPATGNAIVDLDVAAHTMRVRVAFSGLLGMTSAAHIHAPTAVPGSGNTGVATTVPTFAGFPLGVTSGSYDNTLDLTQPVSYNPPFLAASGGTVASAEAALAASIAAGTAYLNVHSNLFPGGEIRGFLGAAPTGACCDAINVCSVVAETSCTTGAWTAGGACGPAVCTCGLVNGGFESGFTGWTQTGNVGFTATQGTFGGVAPQAGANQAVFGPVGSPGGIEQVIHVPAGTNVTVSFWLNMFAGTPNSFTASLGGVPFMSFTDSPAFGYTQFTFTVPATVSDPVLKFDFQNNPSFFTLDSVTACIAPTACCDAVTGACVLAAPGVACGTLGNPAPGGATTCTPSPCPFPGGVVNCLDCWYNGAYDRVSGQVSHLGGSVPLGAKAADDFTLAGDFVHDLRTITATLLTTTTPGLVKPRAEIWSDCNGCPAELLYTFDNATVVETGLTEGVAFDGRPLRIVHVTFDVTNQTVVGNRNVVLHGGNYWLSVYGRSDGLGPTMQMYDVTYWGTTRGFGGGVQGQPAYKIDGVPNPVYNQFVFPVGCGPTAWHSVVDDCCIGCTDLNFSFCSTACKVLVDNGGGRRQLAGEPVGSTSKFAAGTLSAIETRSADDFVIPGCGDYRICYVEACILTNCVAFQGVFELYPNDCGRPSYLFHGTPIMAQQFIATKIVPLGFTAFMEGKTVTAYKLEFHDLNIVIPGGRQYWISAGVKYTFSINERAFFCYNADCSRDCLMRWNSGRTLTAQTLDDYAAAHGCNTPQVCNGWSSVGNDFSFLIAAENVTVPGPINATPSCVVDFNRDGVVNTADIFDYLNGWFTGCP